jgi:hypothetical protein
LVGSQLRVFRQDGRGEGLDVETMQRGDLGGGQGLAPKLDLVQGAVAEAGVARA